MLKPYTHFILTYLLAESLNGRANHRWIFRLADHALKLRSQFDWPREATFPEPSLLGNLYLYRAEALANKVFSQPLPVDEGCLKNALEDYRAALAYFEQVPDSSMDDSFAQATMSYVELVVRHGATYVKDPPQTLETNLNKAIIHARERRNLTEFVRGLMTLGELYVRLFARQNSSYETSAIQCFEEGLELLEANNGLVDNQFLLLNNLARAYLLPRSRQQPENVEKAILCVRKAKALPIKDIGSVQWHSLDLILADASYHRSLGDRFGNLVLAGHCYDAVLREYSPKENAELWPFAVLQWIDVLNQHNCLEDFIEPADKLLQAVMARYAPEEQPEIWYSALKKQQMLAKFQQSFFFSEQSSYTKDIETFQASLDPSLDPSMWVELEVILCDAELKKTLEPADTVQRLKALADQYPLEQWPWLWFRVYFRLGIYCAGVEEWDNSLMYFDKAMNGLEAETDTELRAFSEGKFYHFHVEEPMLRVLPMVMLETDHTADAVKYFDYIYSRRLTDNLETQLLIEHQDSQDHESLRRQHRTTVGFRQIMLAQSLGDSEKAHQRLSDYAELASHLKQQNPQFTRNVVLNHVEKMISQLNTWVFIPMLSNTYSRFVLIPPGATLEEARISEHKEVSYYSEMRALVTEEGGGWMRVLCNDHSQEYIEEMNLETDIMETHLWKTYGDWLLSSMRQRPDIESKDVCVITTGPLTFFPFSMAYSEKECLLDAINISTMSSLYGLWTLQQRLSHHQDGLTLSYLDAEPVTKPLPHAPLQQNLVTHALGEQCNIVKASECSLEKAMATFQENTCWHISSHAQFSFRSNSESSFSFADLSVPANTMAGFKGVKPLRLVYLSACQTGIQDFTKGSEDPEGFFDSFMEVGALGVIGSLWEQFEESAVLLSAWFYEYLIEHQLSPAAALKEAQKRVRDASVAEIRDYLNERLVSGVCSKLEVEAFMETIAEYDEDEAPFSPPLYWAGYVLAGV